MVISWLKKVTKSQSATPPAPVAVELPHDKITQRAYEIWVRKGRPEGQDEQNWKEAEAELRTELTGKPAESLPNRPR